VTSVRWCRNAGTIVRVFTIHRHFVILMTLIIIGLATIFAAGVHSLTDMVSFWRNEEGRIWRSGLRASFTDIDAARIFSGVHFFPQKLDYLFFFSFNRRPQYTG